MMQRHMSSPHIIDIRGCCTTHPNELLIVMEKAHGGELFDRVVAQGKFCEGEAATVMRQVLDAVAFMHARAVIHRDIKPENILLKSRDSYDVVISDFGFARVMSELSDGADTPRDRQRRGRPFCQGADPVLAPPPQAVRLGQGAAPPRAQDEPYLSRQHRGIARPHRDKPRL